MKDPLDPADDPEDEITLIIRRKHEIDKESDVAMDMKLVLYSALVGLAELLIFACKVVLGAVIVLMVLKLMLKTAPSQDLSELVEQMGARDHSFFIDEGLNPWD